MALPGLNLNSVPIVEEKTATITDLQPNSEWRFEVAFGDKVEVKLLSGTAEIFGTELAVNQTYTFTGHKAAVYTWHGCKLEVFGDCQTDYTAEETPMASYANLHFALEDIRMNASGNPTGGPRVMIVGPDNAGKTSLVKLLTGYATRSGRTPIVANLDPKEGMLTVPGAISAVTMESIMDVEEGWGTSPINGPSQIPVKLPLVYYYGHEDLESHRDLSKALIRRMALSVISRMEDDENVKQTGCIIDSPGSISHGRGGYEIVQHVVSEFSVTVLITLGSERLYSEMNKRYPSNSGVTVLKLDKSGGCVDRDSQFMTQVQHSQVREYFFGDARAGLNPHTIAFDSKDVTVWRAADDASMNNSLLPGDSEFSSTASNILERVEPSLSMDHMLLAMLNAGARDSQEQIRDASVVGFLFVTEVDEKKGKVKALAPLSGRLPRQALLWGQWPGTIANLVGN